MSQIPYLLILRDIFESYFIFSAHEEILLYSIMTFEQSYNIITPIMFSTVVYNVVLCINYFLGYLSILLFTRTSPNFAKRRQKLRKSKIFTTIIFIFSALPHFIQFTTCFSSVLSHKIFLYVLILGNCVRFITIALSYYQIESIF